jgi:leucyl aminopeptidase
LKFTVTDRPISAVRAEAAAAFVFEDDKNESDDLRKLDAEAGGQIRRVLEADPRAGKAGWTQVLYTGGKAIGSRVVLAGVGRKKGADFEQWRRAYGQAARAADAVGARSAVSVSPASGADENAIRTVQAAVEGAALAVYFFGEFKERSEGGQLLEWTISADKKRIAVVKEGVRRGEIGGEAQLQARLWSELPGNALPPAALADRAAAVARERGLKCTVFDERRLAGARMHAILAVGRGSRNKPRLVVLEHRGATRKGAPWLALVGKGITFDSGGISLKESTPSNSGGSIDLMRTDKTGACTVVAAMAAVARLNLAVNVVGVAPCAENMPGGDAYRPGDIINTYAGKSVEIMSTDAEGRLVLADALAYTAATYKPKFMVDVATLTGACVIALGEHNIGLFANDDDLCRRVQAASEFAGEPVWRLPLQEPYREQTKSKIADLLNSGGRPGGACTAAAFLWEFAGNTPWAHLDIAGVMHLSKDRPYLPKGAVGMPTRTLIELVRAAAG